jgi:hypothetical protein
MGIYLRISSHVRKPHSHVYDFATAPLLISLYMRKILFSFLSVQVLKVTRVKPEADMKISSVA